MAKKQDLNAVAYYLVNGEVRKVPIGPEGLQGLDHLGIQAIAQDNASTKRETVSGGDFFIQRPDGRWFSVDYFGLIDYVIDNCPNIGIGRMLTTAGYSEVIEEVDRDREGGGRPSWERKK